MCFHESLLFSASALIPHPSYRRIESSAARLSLSLYIYIYIYMCLSVSVNAADRQYVLEAIKHEEVFRYEGIMDEFIIF